MLTCERLRTDGSASHIPPIPYPGPIGTRRHSSLT
jgi:hypothetical protein